MNYFENLSGWMNNPIKQSALEIATLRLDQLMDFNSDRSKPARKFADDYIIYWLREIYLKIVSLQSIAAQADSIETIGDELIEKYSKIEQEHGTDRESFADFTIVFSAEKSSHYRNNFINKMKYYSRNKEITIYNHFLFSNAGSEMEYNQRQDYFIVFPLPYSGKYYYDPMSIEYLNNIAIHLINCTVLSLNKKFLISFDFVSNFKTDDKKRFFRSFIRSILISYSDNFKINLKNIKIYLELKDDVKLFNRELINIIQLIKYNSTFNTIKDWNVFFEKHPYKLEGKLREEQSIDEPIKSNSGTKFVNNLPIKDIELPTTLQGKVKTKSPVFRQFLSYINVAAESEINILLLGETGVGKGELANQIHQTSLRKDKPFVALNCAAIPDSLIDSELFGSIKGAYTDSKKDKMGKIEAANGGVLFLDEIGNAPLTVQQKILTFIQSKKFHPVGSEAVEKEVDVRIFFATNKQPEELVSSGQMLADFYFRIIEPNYTVPALRERSEDIPEFINYFIQVYQTKIKWQLKPTPDARSRMCELNWPGNIRQLENAILKLFLNCKARKVNEFNAEDVNEVISDSVSFDQKSIINNYEISYNKLFDNYLMRRDQLKKIEYDQENQTTKVYQKQNQHSFLKLIVEPIAANHYKTLSLNKIEASKILGLDGSNGENSLLDQKALLYYKIKEYFK